MPKIAIATLVKFNENDYNRWEDNLIIVRNKSIKENYHNLCDLIIFHEGNLKDDYVKKIMNLSCVHFPIKFVEIPNFKLSNKEFETLKPKMMDIGNVRTGYSSMCRFWSYIFLDYLKEYDYLIRIDDDCIVLNDIQPIIDNLNNNYLSFPFLSSEDYRVGLKDFIKEYFNIDSADDRLSVPYTNFCAFNLNKIKANTKILNLFKKIEENQYIHTHTWNDTLIWGMVMKYILNEEDYSENRNVKYIHLSHLDYVN